MRSATRVKRRLARAMRPATPAIPTTPLSPPARAALPRLAQAQAYLPRPCPAPVSTPILRRRPSQPESGSISLPFRSGPITPKRRAGSSCRPVRKSMRATRTSGRSRSARRCGRSSARTGRGSRLGCSRRSTAALRPSGRTRPTRGTPTNRPLPRRAAVTSPLTPTGARIKFRPLPNARAATTAGPTTFSDSNRCRSACRARRD